MEQNLFTEQNNDNTENKMQEEMEELLETIRAACTFGRTSISRSCFGQPESNDCTSPRTHTCNGLLGYIPSRSLQTTIPKLCYTISYPWHSYENFNSTADQKAFHNNIGDAIAFSTTSRKTASNSCDSSNALYDIDINELKEY